MTRESEEGLVNCGVRDQSSRRARAGGRSVEQIYVRSRIPRALIPLLLVGHRNQHLPGESAPLVPKPVAIKEIAPPARAVQPPRSRRLVAVVVGVVVAAVMTVVGLYGIWCFNTTVEAIDRPMTEFFDVPLFAAVNISAWRLGYRVAREIRSGAAR